MEFKTDSRNLFFNVNVNQESISHLTKKIVEINESDARTEAMIQAGILPFTFNRPPIKIYIDTYGGEVYPILGLISLIESSKTPIHTICTGIAASAGFMLLISGHKRFAHKYSTLMYHQLSSGTAGTLKEMEESIEQKAKLQSTLEAIVKEKTKISGKTLKESFEKKIDLFYDVNQAIALGCIDEII